MSRRIRITSTSVAVIGIAVTTALLWSVGDQSKSSKELRINRLKTGDAESGIPTTSTNVIYDFFRQKYGLAQRAVFHVTSSQPIAIFVLATGVQVRTDSGWESFSEEPRNEIWRLKPGIAQEVFVERPQSESEQVWRAFVRYGSEMNGPVLWKAQLREAWQMRSFTNWTGQAWGGGRFGGRYDFFTEEFPE